MNKTDLHAKLLELVKSERSLLAEIIDHLQRAYDTRLYAVRGHNSLFVYLVKELGYSEAAAYRRVNAVKMVKEIHSIKEDVQMGRLHLNTLADAATAFRNEEKVSGPVSVVKKAETISRLAGKSRRESQKVLAIQFPSAEMPKESEKIIATSAGETRHQCTVLFTEEDMKVICRLKEIYPQMTLSEILILTAHEHVQRKDPMERAKPAVLKRNIIVNEDAAKEQESPPENNSKNIPADVKHLVRMRDQGRCCYMDPETGQVCGAKSGLEFDHIQPQALGGEHRLDNLQLLCRTHNLLRAHRTFPEKVNPFWSCAN